MVTGQGKVYSARGVRTALCNMPGGVPASATGAPQCHLKTAPFKCELLSVLEISVYTHVHAYTQKGPFSRLPLAAPVCSNLCRQLYKFARAALELSCDVTM